MRKLLLILLVSVQPALARESAPRPAASWPEVFAAETDSMIFLGEDGAMCRAPFHLAVSETLWRPRPDERVRRVLLAPGRQRAAWLCVRNNEDSTQLWVGGREGPRLVARFRNLRPSAFNVSYFEPMVPTIRDPGIQGGRFIRATSEMYGITSNALAWTPDGTSLVYASEDGVSLTRADGTEDRRVSKARVVKLRSLAPSPLFLARVIRKTEDEMELADCLLFPSRVEWKVVALPGLSFDGPWAATTSTVWWADGKTIRAVRAHDPSPTVEFTATDRIVWLEYDASRSALAWAAGRQIVRRSEGETDLTVVHTTRDPIRRVIGPSAGGSLGVVEGDALFVWKREADSFRRVSLGGIEPLALFEARSGECVVAERPPGWKLGIPLEVTLETGKRPATSLSVDLVPPPEEDPPLHRIEFDAGRIVPIDRQDSEGGSHWFASSSGSYLLQVRPGPWLPGPVRGFDIDTKRWKEFKTPSDAKELMRRGVEAPEPILHVYDLRTGVWIEVKHPGLAAWESLE